MYSSIGLVCNYNEVKPMTRTTLDIDKLRQLASQADSFPSLLRLVGGGGHRRLKRLLLENDINTSHFRTYGVANRRPLSVYLANEHPISSDPLKKRLFKEGLKRRTCERCNRSEWLDEPMPLELHHVDGNHLNNTIDNLQVLCRNCHGLADNHKGAGKRRKKATRVSRAKYIETILTCPNAYEVCKTLGLTAKGRNYDTIYGIMAKEGLSFKTIEEKEQPRDLNGLHSVIEMIPRPMSAEGKARRRAHEPRIYGTRKEAALARRKTKWPTQEELQRLVWEKPVEMLAVEYGVKGNAIRHWAKRLGVALSPSGYWIRRNAGYDHERALVSQRRIRPPLRRPTKEQAGQAHSIIQNGGSLRQAGKAIGFDHETTKVALIRFGLLTPAFKGQRGRRASLTLIGGDKSSSTITI